MNKIYQVAGHRFMVSGKELCTVTEGIAGFKPFEVQQKDALFVFLKSADVPIMDSVHTPSSMKMSPVLSGEETTVSY